MRATNCPSCVAALDHCHGTLVVHVGRIAECTETDCFDLDHARHTFIVECADLAGGCRCGAPAARDVVRAG